MDNIGKQFHADKAVNTTWTANASIPRRIGAFIIDLLFINIFLAAPFTNILQQHITQTIPTTIPQQLYLAIGALATIALLYFALLESYEQQTLGMMLFNIYVTPKPSFWQGILRNLYIYPFFPFNLLWIIEPIYLYYNDRRLLERFTDTRTVISNE